jgi:NAD(P)H-dependent FMN reductase
MKIAIILSSVRKENSGKKVSKFAIKIVKEKDWTPIIVDPAEFNLPMLDKTYSEMLAPEQKFVLLHNLLVEADGYLIVTAEYNHNVPSALTNLLNHFAKEYNHKPSAIISYSSGPFAGVRAAEQLKLICSTLGMPSIPNVLAISKANESFDDEGNSVNGDYERRSKSFLNEFDWYLQAFKNQREK